MYKEIMIDKANAAKIPQIVFGANKTNTQANKEYKARNLKDKFEKVTAFFRDIEGNAYVVIHGLGFVGDDGLTYGYLMYNGDRACTPAFVYKKAVENGFIKKNEVLNIICCHGGQVKAQYMREVKQGYNDKCPVKFINNTEYPVYSRLVSLKNGTVRLSLGTRETLKERLFFELKSNF